MKPVRALLVAAAAALLFVFPVSGAQRLTTEALGKRVEEEKQRIAQKLDQARGRMDSKNFLAARASVDDANRYVKRLLFLMPWHRFMELTDDAVERVNTRFWNRAESTIDTAFRELDYLAQYVDVTEVWQHLDAAKQAVREKNEDIARQELKAAKEKAPVSDVVGPLRRAQGYLDGAKDELLKLPILFKGKREAARKSLDKAEAELRKAYPYIEDVLKGKYSKKGRATP